MELSQLGQDRRAAIDAPRHSKPPVSAEARYGALQTVEEGDGVGHEARGWVEGTTDSSRGGWFWVQCPSPQKVMASIQHAGYVGLAATAGGALGFLGGGLLGANVGLFGSFFMGLVMAKTGDDFDSFMNNGMIMSTRVFAGLGVGLGAYQGFIATRA